MSTLLASSDLSFRVGCFKGWLQGRSINKFKIARGGQKWETSIYC